MYVSRMEPLIPGEDVNVYIIATSWENLFMPYTNNKGADQTAHPQSLISAFVVRFLDCLIHILAKSKTLKALASLCIAEQAGLSLTLSQTPETGFIVTRLKIKISIAKDQRFF